MGSILWNKLDRRRLLTSLAAGAALTNVASLISDAACAAPSTFRFASPDDTAIFTKKGLLEIDRGLTCIAELEPRLDHALRNPKVLNHIAITQSRFFALGSVTLNAPPSEQLILDFQTTLDRQCGYVSRNFGPLATDDLPIYIATAIDEGDRVVRTAVLDVIVYITCKSGFRPGAKITRAKDVFCIANAPRRLPNALDLIALWPFNA
jgi:hypothetical protein